MGQDIFAGLKNIIGGEISEYTKLQAQSREQALQRMIEDAERMGANAIVNVRLTTSMVMQGCSENPSLWELLSWWSKMELLFFLVCGVLLVYLLYKKGKEEKEENFEDREY